MSTQEINFLRALQYDCWILKGAKVTDRIHKAVKTIVANSWDSNASVASRAGARHRRGTSRSAPASLSTK